MKYIISTLLVFLLFGLIGVLIGFHMSRMGILENELKKYIIAVEIKEAINNNDISLAREITDINLSNQKLIGEALAKSNTDLYNYHKQQLIK